MTSFDSIVRKLSSCKNLQQLSIII